MLGGEDFQLVFTAPKELSQVLENLGSITLIGEVIEGEPMVQSVTKAKEIRLLEAKGYNHFHE